MKRILILVVMIIGMVSCQNDNPVVPKDIYSFSSATLTLSNFQIERTINGSLYDSGQEMIYERIDTLIINHYEFFYDFSLDDGINKSNGDTVDFTVLVTSDLKKYFKCIVNSNDKKFNDIETEYDDFTNTDTLGLYESNSYSVNIPTIKYVIDKDGNYISEISNPEIKSLIFQFSNFYSYLYQLGDRKDKKTSVDKFLGTTDSSKITLTLVPKK